MTKVSVIVPVYNVEKYIDRCLTSLVKQNFDDYEIIVVNDGSLDNSEKVILKYKELYPNIIKYFSKTNGGLSDARNYGIKKAEGDYLTFVDSDDYVSLDFLKKLYDKAILSKSDIVVCDTIDVCDSSERYIKSYLGYSEDDIKNYIISPPMAWIRLYKRFIFDKVSFKKGIWYEDLYFSPSLFLITKNISFVNEGLYYHVQRSGSIMQQTSFNEKSLDIFDVLDYNKKKLGKKYPLEVEYLFITHLLRSATLRFLEYENTKNYLKRIREIIKKEFPNWNKNIYYKKSSKKLKMICFLAYHKQYWILKILLNKRW